MFVRSQKRMGLATRISFVLIVTVMALIVIVPIAFAASWEASANTACAGGWSILTWGGYNFWDWGRTTAWLWYWDGSSWMQDGEQDSGQVFGDGGSLSPLARPWVYFSNRYYQGTGGSVASFFQGQVNRFGPVVWCQ